MMSADFDAFEGGTPTPKPEEDPLAMFNSTNDEAGDGGDMPIFGGTAGDGYNISEGADAPSNSNNMQSADLDIFDNANVNQVSDDGDEMEELQINDNDDAHREEESEEEGEDLLDMEGWNLRRQRNEEDDEPTNNDSDETYGTDQNTPNIQPNAKGARNNSSRRGLFGGWGSSRNNKSHAEGDDLLSGDTASASPSWSNSSSGGGGGGLFRRRGNNNASSPTVNNNSEEKDPDSPYASVPRDGIDEAALAYGEGGITGDADIEGEIIDAEIEEEQRFDNHLRPGDHIYIWQTYGINPRAYQRHAVVFSVTKRGEVDPMTQRPPQGPSSEIHDEQLSFDMDTLYSDEEDDVEVTVVSFYHFNRYHAAHGAAQAQAAANGGNKKGKRSGCKREFLYDFIGPDGINRKKPVHKVRYGRKVKRGLLSQKAGVGTALKKDQVGLIIARVQYLLDHPDHLPDHNALSANGECASLWCVTGRWCTLQGASILAITAVGQAGGALVAGGILSNLTLLVPMPGVWGMAGWWWYVPATVAYPFLVPMLVTLGMASLVPLEILRRNRKRWRGITDGLNHEFWSGTSESIKEEYFGVMATAEREAEMRSFFGVRENDTSAADDAKYMPVGGTPGGLDSDDEDEEAEAMAMQQMERSCQNMAADMNVDLSGRPPSTDNGSQKGAWGSFMGSFRRKESGLSNGGSNINETERFHTSY